MSCTAHPTREHANVTDDTCGSTATRSGPYSRIRVLPIPCSSGSPLATTCTSPSTPSSNVCRAGSIGDGHSRRSPLTLSSSRSSCRREPKITAARRNSSRDVGARPAIPSAPMPTTMIIGVLGSSPSLLGLLFAQALIAASSATRTAAAAASRRRTAAVSTESTHSYGPWPVPARWRRRPAAACSTWVPVSCPRSSAR